MVTQERLELTRSRLRANERKRKIRFAMRASHRRGTPKTKSVQGWEQGQGSLPVGPIHPRPAPRLEWRGTPGVGPVLIAHGPRGGGSSPSQCPAWMALAAPTQAPASAPLRRSDDEAPPTTKPRRSAPLPTPAAPLKRPPSPTPPSPTNAAGVRAPSPPASRGPVRARTPCGLLADPLSSALPTRPWPAPAVGDLPAPPPR